MLLLPELGAGQIGGLLERSLAAVRGDRMQQGQDSTGTTVEMESIPIRPES